MNERPMILMVETAKGVLVREIRSASPLREGLEQGKAAEEATHDAAALWGMPDFVFRPAIVRVGSSAQAGVREVGDGLLVVGTLGVVVQVKTRQAPSEDEIRERRWIESKIGQGLRQGHGTIRRLKNKPVSMINGRGRSLEVNGAAMTWVVVVVLDHADAPEGINPPVADQPNPSVVLLRREWEFLFEQLKSSRAVIRYLMRVAGEPDELGTEVMRYFQLAQADEEAEPGPVDERLLREGAKRFSGPLLPMEAAGDDASQADLLVRLIFEDIAVSIALATEEDRLRFLAALDNLPVQGRGLVGEFLVEAMGAAASTAEGTEWRVRSVIPPPEGGQTVQLGFGVCSARFSAMVRDVFSWWVQLRHHEVYETVAADGGSLTTVGVVLTPRGDGVRPWDTTMIATSGDLQLDAEVVAEFRKIWPGDPL
jgi:hypothetical protein